jgi:hypothetical protein
MMIMKKTLKSGRAGIVLVREVQRAWEENALGGREFLALLDLAQIIADTEAGRPCGGPMEGLDRVRRDGDPDSVVLRLDRGVSQGWLSRDAYRALTDLLLQIGDELITADEAPGKRLAAVAWQMECEPASLCDDTDEHGRTATFAGWLEAWAGECERKGMDRLQQSNNFALTLWLCDTGRIPAEGRRAA